MEIQKGGIRSTSHLLYFCQHRADMQNRMLCVAPTVSQVRHTIFRWKMRNSKNNCLQMISFTLQKRNCWNCRVLPYSSVQQRTGTQGWFQGFLTPLLTKWIPKQWEGGGQQGLTGSLLRGLLHELPWLVESWQGVPFHELKNQLLLSSTRKSFSQNQIWDDQDKVVWTKAKVFVGKESSSEA